MARSANVVVVGGGVMGVSVALSLLDRGVARVWLLEKSYLAAGSSGKSGAILRQHYSHAETVRMAREGLGFYREFKQRHGYDIGFEQTGMLFLVDAHDRDGLNEHVRMQSDCGVPTRVVDEADMAAIEPRGRYEEDCLGCYEENSGYVDPRLAVAGMAEIARGRGLQISVGERVTGLLRQGDRVTGVVTTHGEIHADCTVLTAGPWTHALLEQANVTLPLTVVRPEQAFLEPPEDFGPPSPIFADLRLGYYWKGEGFRRTRVGSVSFDGDDRVTDPDDYDEGASGAFVSGCRDSVAQRLPAYDRATIWGGCGALYTVTPDAHPMIGAVPGCTGCWMVAGFSGHGFKLAPAVGRGMAEWIVDGAPQAFPASFFDPQRFERNQPIESGYEYGILG